ncbi:MAG: winged helix-turn-helix transcriptional regulator [Alphaproteobacteria bacterium]|nr:winged helix-turn-helix transcriptional regulator [Alphaproteobacteria bacterium]
MKEGPSIAPIAALAGDPARANMLSALLSGMALTVSELAGEAGVTLPTASSHLAKLEAGGLVAGVRQGRHRYFRLADPAVAEMLERILEVAARAGHLRTRPGPGDPQLRKARVCYDHLAGELGVRLFEAMKARKAIRERDGRLELGPKGNALAGELGIDLDTLAAGRRVLCRPCLDWSMRRHHLAGGLGAAILDRVIASGWARRARGSRAVLFSRNGERHFEALLRG